MGAYPSSSAPVPTQIQLRPLFAEQHPAGSGRLPIPCIYCRREIEAGSFVFWSPAHLLLSATCPDCHRRTTLWRTSWTRLSDPARARAEESAR